ncbi:hypothetical protein [Bacillus pseudomycoides]|nr:hypothetical protein [Bacillus pseudomycoides]
MSILSFIIRTILKILMFTITLSFAVIKFVLAIVLLIFTLGAIGSRTSRY